MSTSSLVSRSVDVCAGDEDLKGAADDGADDDDDDDGVAGAIEAYGVVTVTEGVNLRSSTMCVSAVAFGNLACVFQTSNEDEINAPNH
jgi:hypothetical protein